MIKNARKDFGKSKPSGMDTPFRRSWVKLKRNKAALVGGIMILIYAGCALLAPFLSPESPTALNLMKSLEPPSLEDFLGTDELGRSILGRIIYGSRVSLMIAVGVVFFGLILCSWRFPVFYWPWPWLPC